VPGNSPRRIVLELNSIPLLFGGRTDVEPSLTLSAASFNATTTVTFATEPLYAGAYPPPPLIAGVIPLIANLTAAASNSSSNNHSSNASAATSIVNLTQVLAEILQDQNTMRPVSQVGSIFFIAHACCV
jgi:hypothetical protein